MQPQQKKVMLPCGPSAQWQQYHTLRLAIIVGWGGGGGGAIGIQYFFLVTSPAASYGPESGSALVENPDVWVAYPHIEDVLDVLDE
jgi:hypothetical protein